MSLLAPSIETASHEWKTIHNELKAVIEKYASACITLEQAFYQAQPSFYEEHHAFDTSLGTLAIDVQQFDHYQQELTASLARLRKTCNLAYDSIPINRLPSTILSAIFSMLVGPKHAERTHFPPKSPPYEPVLTTLMSVCAGWRDLVVHTPTMWSTVFFDMGDPTCQLSSLFFERAGQAPLAIQAMIRYDHLEHSWTSVLAPRHNQISSLDLVMPSMDFLRAILSVWPTDNPAPLLKRVDIKLLRTQYVYGSAHPRVLPENSHAQFLGAVTEFSLCGGYFDWDSAAFAGLESLQLAWTAEPGPTLSQLTNMLRASPRLRTLSLLRIPITFIEQTDRQPIQLKHLEKLTLMSCDPPSTCALVELLLPGTQPLTVYLEEALVTDAEIDIFKALFQRSNVQSLYLNDGLDWKAIRILLDGLPQLRFAYFSEFNIDDILKGLSSTSDDDTLSDRPLPCPMLQRMCLHKCSNNDNEPTYYRAPFVKVFI